MSNTGAVRPTGDHPSDELHAGTPGGDPMSVDPATLESEAPEHVPAAHTPPHEVAADAAADDDPPAGPPPGDDPPAADRPEAAQPDGSPPDVELDGGWDDGFGDGFSGEVHPANSPAPVDLPDEQAAGAVRARLAAPDVPPRTLGDLGELAVWAAGVQGRAPAGQFRRVRALVIAADHGVASRGVSAFPAADSARRARRLLTGGGGLALLAGRAGVTLRLVDVGLDIEPLAVASTRRIRRGSGSIDVEDALTIEEALDAYALGRALVDEEVDAGADLLVPCVLGVGATTPAAVVVAALTDTEPAAVVGRGSGIDDETWMRKCVAIRDALRRARPHVHEMTALLAAVGGADIAVTAGMLLQAAVRRTPVLLDGVVVAAAALIARDTTPDAVPWWQVLDRSDEPAERVALEALGLQPLLALGLRAGGGTGALAALPLLQTAVSLVGDLGLAPEPDPPDLESDRSSSPQPVVDSIAGLDAGSVVDPDDRTGADVARAHGRGADVEPTHSTGADAGPSYDAGTDPEPDDDAAPGAGRRAAAAGADDVTGDVTGGVIGDDPETEPDGAPFLDRDPAAGG